MTLSLLNNRISLPIFRGLINAIVTACNTNTTDIATNTADIATNTSDISALNSSKQTANAVSTLRYNYNTSVTTNYTLLGTDENSIFDITNIGATVFNLPNTGTIAQFSLGGTVIVSNNEASGGNIVLTPTGASTLQVGTLSATLLPGETAWVIRSGTNRYKRLF